jgi:hypothetical protein
VEVPERFADLRQCAIFVFPRAKRKLMPWYASGAVEVWRWFSRMQKNSKRIPKKIGVKEVFQPLNEAERPEDYEILRCFEKMGDCYEIVRGGERAFEGMRICCGGSGGYRVY